MVGGPVTKRLRVRNTAIAGLLLLPVICSAQTGRAQGTQRRVPVAVYEKAVEALRGEQFPEAERILQEALRVHPSDARALSLMGVVLDALKRYEEAEGYYKRAIQANPRSTSVLNNLGNHYLQRGLSQQALTAYKRVLSLDPTHLNANLQLARLSTEANQGATALKHLARLPAEQQSSPPVQILRAQALRSAGQEAESLELLRKLETRSAGDPRLSYSLGIIYADWQQYQDAERAFTKALEAAPTNFDILYNLGLAALRNRNFERAKQVFEVALNQRPNDVDLLQNLARVAVETGQQDLAIMLLVQAEKIAPERPDVQFFLGRVAAEQGYYGDAASAFDKYLQLRPDDDTVRRERGYALVRSAKIDEGLKDLRWYVETYPKDAYAWYQLGIAETVGNRERALECFNKAIELDPALYAARFSRGMVLLQADKPAEASEEQKIVLAHDPNDAHALDALGQAQLLLGQIDEALESFRRALEISPKERRFLAHYSRALQRAGRRDEAKAAMDRFRLLRPEDEYTRRAKGGLFDYLKLPPDELRALYLKHLRAGINLKPEDAVLHARLGTALLAEGNLAEALDSFRTVLRLTSDPKILSDCARTLLAAEQYDAAKEILVRILADDKANLDASLDLAIAIFHTTGAEAGLAEVDQIEPERRNGDYFLLRAQMLDALGRPKEAEASLNQGLAREPTRPDLYFKAALFLIKHREYEEAARLLDHASRRIPDSPELMLVQAINQEFRQRPEECVAVLEKIQSRWPEWSLPYLIHGMILEVRSRSAQARPLLETAVALGAQDPAAYYYLSTAISHAAPEDLDGAQQAIDEALKLDPNDAYIQSQAGKVAYAKKDYAKALEHLNAALRLWPEMVEARQTLSGVYRALGDREKSAAELKEIVRIKQANPTADQTPPFPVGDLLFSVRPTARPGS